MNTIAMLVCLAGGVAPTQDTRVFQESNVQVKLQVDAPTKGRKADPYHVLLYNRINIGTNYLKPTNRADLGKPDLDFSRLPTTYFHEKSPIGVAMQKFNWFPGKENTFSADVRLPASLAMPLDPYGRLCNLWSEPPIAVVGMDVGTMAAYARLGQTVHFFERIPTFVKLSLPEKDGERYFHFIHDAQERGANVKIFEGEPRATLEKYAGDGFYQIIVVNTYKLAVSTVHKDLMTREALEMLMAKTREDGLLCFHVSNRYYDLAPVIAAAADANGFVHLRGNDRAPWNDDQGRRNFSSDWVMVARKGEYLSHLKTPKGYNEAAKVSNLPERFWEQVPVNSKYTWTDAGENSFRGLYFSDPTIGEFGNSLYALEDFINNQTGFHLYPHTRPIHDALQTWGRSRANSFNRDEPKK